MSWVIYAIASIFLIGAFNLFLEATKDTIPKGFHYTHMYLCCILVLTGVLAGISLICYHFLYPNALSDISSKIKPSYYLTVIMPAIILFSYLITNTLALAQGGGIAVSIINLNMFVTILAGVLLFNDKINNVIIVSMIVAFISIGVAAYENYRINK